MIDWVTAEIPLLHTPLASGCVIKITPDGEIAWETPVRVSVTGSWDDKFSVRSTGASGDGSGRATLLQVSGNPSKFLQGHNIVGSDDLIGLMLNACQQLFKILKLEPSWQEADALAAGNYTVSRVDINYMFELPCLSDVTSWIRSAEYASKTRHGRPQCKAGTIYWGKHSRRWAIKAYSKFIELKKRPLPESLIATGLKEYSENKLRLELVLRRMELHDLGIASAVGISNYGITDLYNQYIKRIEMSENVTLKSKIIDELPGRLRSTYTLWTHGEVMSEVLSKATYYRHRKELLDYGIDIMTVRPTEAKSNVIPLMRILEAKQCDVPEWVYEKGLIAL